MNKVNIKEKFKLFDQYWSPKILGELNGNHVKIFKAKGEFVWHQLSYHSTNFTIL